MKYAAAILGLLAACGRKEASQPPAPTGSPLPLASPGAPPPSMIDRVRESVRQIQSSQPLPGAELPK